jgi:hypothetical protein
VRLEDGGFLEMSEGVPVAACIKHPDTRHEVLVADCAYHGELLLASLFLG